VLVTSSVFFFVAGHQVDIELGDATLRKRVELLAMRVDGPDQQKRSTTSSLTNWALSLPTSQ